MARSHNNGAETSGLSVVALGLTQSVNKEVKRADTGTGLGVSDQAVGFGTSMGEFIRGSSDANWLTNTEESLVEMFDGSGFGNVGDLRTWCQDNDTRDDLSLEEMGAVQAYYDIVDAITLATLASTARMSDEVVQALGGNNPNGRSVEEALGIGEDSPLAGVGEMMIDVAIVDPDYAEVLVDLNRAVEVGDYRGGVNDAMRRMDHKDLKDQDSPEWNMIVTYLHEMRAANDAQNGGRGRPIPERRPGARNDSGGVDMEEFTYDMKRSRFTEMERQNKAIRWYDERPPAWYEEMSPDERDLIDIRLKLLGATANKEFLRNRDVEKLRGNVPEISSKELRLLWTEMPGFKEGLRFFVQDLCEDYLDADGRRMLRLKTIGGPDMTQDVLMAGGGKLQADVKDKVENFSRYKKSVVAELKKSVPEITESQAVEAASVAWNFLYIGDSVESWDLFRELKPTSIVSDKLRTIFHPRIKALGKWGVWKGSIPRGQTVTDEGQEEPFVEGPLSTWVLDRLKVEPGFKQRLIDGDLAGILPNTMAVSMIEATKIGDTNMAMALMEKSDAWILSKLGDDDKNVMQAHNDMVQAADWLMTVVKGKIPYGDKNAGAFVSAFLENTSLIRQGPTLPTVGGNLRSLAFVDRPEFYAWAVLTAVGFDPRDKNPVLSSAPLGVKDNVAYIKADQLISRITIGSSVDRSQIKKILGISSLLDWNARRASNATDRYQRG
jgi:hypothetical protein